MECSPLSGKRIMLIAADFFGIPLQIKAGMEAEGAMVDYFDERPGNSFYTKALIRLNRDLLSQRVNSYYDDIIESTRDLRYDYVVIIKGECISGNSMRQFRKYHPKSKFILYQWDSVTYNRQFHTIKGYFDSLKSFDRQDCQQYGMEFLPGFYPNEYAQIQHGSEKYDAGFVGTVNTDRYEVVQKIKRQFLQSGSRWYDYFYVPYRLVYFRKKIKELFSSSKVENQFHYQALDSEQLRQVYAQLRTVVDVQKPMQRGLTWRTFEALGARRKLITTNSDIVNYDFYHPNNILVVDRRNPIIPAQFIASPYSPLPHDLYQSYSLNSWLYNLLGVK